LKESTFRREIDGSWWFTLLWGRINPKGSTFGGVNGRRPSPKVAACGRRIDVGFRFRKVFFSSISFFEKKWTQKHDRIESDGLGVFSVAFF